MESVDNRFEFRFRRAAAITSVLICVAAAVRLVGRELGRSKSMGDGSGRVRIDGMGDMSNGGDGNGRRGMDGSGLARTTGSGCGQGFGWVFFLVFFSLARWARLSLRCGDNRGENTGGFWQERRLEDRSCPGVLDVMCASEIQFSIAMTCF